MFSLPSSSSSSSSLLEELYTPGESPILSSKSVDPSRLCGEEDPLGHLGCADRGDSPLLGWEGDYDSENPLLFPSPGYERDLPQGVQQEPLLAQDLHAHPLSLKQHRDSISASVKSAHSHSHSRSNSRPASQELPLPLPASVIPQLHKRKRVSKNPSLGQVPLYAVSETSAPVLAPIAPATVTVIPPPPTSPHCVPLPLSPPAHVDGFHIPSASISSISTMASTPSTPMFDVFNASPIKRSESSTSVSLGVHSHSRGGSSASAAASLHSLSLSLSSDASCRNAVYISDESDLEVLDYTLSSPHGSVLDLQLEEPGNTRTIYVENNYSDKAHHRIGSAFLGAEDISSEMKRSSTLYVGPSSSSSGASPSTAVEVMHQFDTPNPTPIPHDNSSPENSPFAPSFQFSTRESGSSGTRTSHGTTSEDELQKKLQSRWSVTSSILEFPAVPPSTPANGSTPLLPLPPAPKPSDEPSEYPMPLARAPTMTPKEVKGKRRSRRSSLVPFVSGLREKTDVEEEKEEKGKKAFKKAMSRLQGQGLPESVDGQRGQRKRASSSFGRTEGTSISVAIEEAKREYKDVPITHTTSKRARLASLISRLSLAPPSATASVRGLQLGTIPGTPPTPDFPTPTQSSSSSHSHHRHFPKASTASSSTGGTPRESCSVDDKGGVARHRHHDLEVNLPLSLNGNPAIGNDDDDHGDRGMETSGIGEQRRPSLSHSIASPPRSPSSSTFPTMPLSPTHSSHYQSRPSVSSASSGLTSPPRSPTKMRFAVNKHELIELEIPPVPLGPAPVPPGHPSSNSNPSSPVGLMPSVIPHEFGGIDTMGGFGMDTAKRLPSVPAPHIRITPDTIRDTRSPPPQEVHKTPTKKKKFSTMLGLRGSRSESVLRLESPHAHRSSPPLASPALPVSQSAMPSPVLSGSLSPPMMTPPMSPPPHPAAYNPTRSPLATSYSPNQERLEVRTVKNRPKSAGGGLRERFKAFGARAWHGQGKEEVPPPVPSKEGVGMAF